MATTMSRPMSNRRLRLPDGSRSVQSVWVWRGFAMMSLLALGLSITFAVGHQTYYAVAWGTITAGWLGISMWLWRKHIKYDNEVWEASRPVVRSSSTKSTSTKTGRTKSVSTKASSTSRPGRR
jgi:hypothetical protein